MDISLYHFVWGLKIQLVIIMKLWERLFRYYSLKLLKDGKIRIIFFLQGTELEFSGLQIDFKADIHKTEYCKVALNDNNLKAFLYAGFQRFLKKFGPKFILFLQ